MKNKKTLWVILVALLFIGVLLAYHLFKPMTVNDIDDKPHFTGIVTEVLDKTIMVSVSEDENELRSSDKMVVSLDVKVKDSLTDFNVGDSVEVYYDGTIAESYPAQINTVYAILLVNE